MKTVEELLAKENEKLEKLTEKRDALQEKIDAVNKKMKLCRDSIARYEMMRNNNQFSELSNALASQNINMDDIMAAIKAGDFLALQEKLETATDEQTDVVAGE